MSFYILNIFNNVYIHANCNTCMNTQYVYICTFLAHNYSILPYLRQAKNPTYQTSGL